MSFQEQPVVVAYSVCGCVPDCDGCSAASAYIANERHAEGDGELLLK